MSDFGQELVTLRRQARLSQLALAELSGVSQRHISFLESGRSKPGAKAVRKLATALALNFGEENGFYAKAGLVPPRPEFDVRDEAFDAARQVIKKMLDQHAPFPGVATLRCGRIIAVNHSFSAALSWAFGNGRPWTPSDHEENLFELTLHKDGLRGYMLNPEQIIPHTLRRLRRAANQNREAGLVMKRLKADPDLQAYFSMREPASSATSSVLVERYHIREQTLNLISMVASFGSPEDVTAQSLQIELFYPEDRSTEDFLKQISKM